jgi:hypothetical protein
VVMLKTHYFPGRGNRRSRMASVRSNGSAMTKGALE